MLRRNNLTIPSQVYHPSTIPLLVKILTIALKSLDDEHRPVAYVALTLRNEDTMSNFLRQAGGPLSAPSDSLPYMTHVNIIRGSSSGLKGGRCPRRPQHVHPEYGTWNRYRYTVCTNMRVADALTARHDSCNDPCLDGTARGPIVRTCGLRPQSYHLNCW